MNNSLVKRIFIIYLVIMGIAFIGIASYYGANSTNIIFQKDLAVKFNNGWFWEKGPDSVPVEIPGKVSINKGEWFTITNTLPPHDEEETVLCLRGSMTSVRAQCGDDILYEYISMPGEQESNLPGSMWHIIKLPSKYDGCKIRLSLKSDTSAFSGELHSMYIGSKTAVLYKLLSVHGFSLLMAIALLVIGLIFLGVYIVTRNKFDYTNLFYLSFTVIFIALWLASESKLLQLFIGNYYITTKSTFVFLGLLPIPLALFLENTYKKNHKTIGTLFAAVFAVNIVVATFLHVTGKVDYFLSMKVTTNLLIVMIAYFILNMLYEAIHEKNKEALRALLPFTIPFIFGAFEFAHLFTENYMEVGKSIQFGIAIYLIVLIVGAIKNLDNFSKEYHETKYFLEWAFKDMLTGAKNRSAFIVDIEKYCDEVDNSSGLPPGENRDFYMFIFDLNGLKLINDQFGHSAGDRAIKAAYQCICKASGNPDSVYRLGGDEFACILHNFSEEAAEQLLIVLKGASREMSHKEKLNISVAAGYDHYTKGRWENFDAFYNYVDSRMYLHKREIKSEISGSHII